MKILVIPSWYPPKGGRFFQEQAEAMAAHGHEVHVLAFNEHSLKEFTFKQRSVFSEENVTVHEHKFWRIPKLHEANERRFIKQYVKFASLKAQEIQPDIIHAHSVCWGGFVAHHLFETMNIPYVITEHRGRFLLHNQSDLLIKDWHKPLLINALQNAHHVIAVSEKLAEGLRQFAELQIKQLSTIYNMVHFPPALDKNEPSSDFQFAFVGSLEEHKGIKVLLDALLIYKEKYGIDFHLKIAGKGSLIQSTKRWLRKNKLMEHVTLLGQITNPQVHQLLNNSNALLSTSQFESFGVNLVEALYHGLPVVATKSGGTQNIVNENNGLLVPYDTKAICEAMRQMRLTANNYDGASISNEARRFYDPSKIYPQIEAILKKALNE